MKRMLIGIICAFLTCGIGVYLFYSLNSSSEINSCEACLEVQSRPINDVAFSKLYENQDDFEGYIVRVNVTLANDDNYISISDNLGQNIIDVGFNVVKTWNCCQLAKKKIRKIENSLWGVVTAQATVIGKLEKNTGISNSKFIFKILCVENIG